MSKNRKQIDKSWSSFGFKSEFSGRVSQAYVGHEFSNGRRGMAKAVRGAKKFVRSRTRFHENAMLKKIIKQQDFD